MFSNAGIQYTDVLVIGGGAAGARAALESSQAGAETTLVVKGRFGVSGTSCYRVAEAAGFSAAGFSADTGDSVNQHKEDILAAGLGPCSEELAGILAENAPKQVKFLEDLGVVYQRYGEHYLATKGCFASRFRSLKVKGHGVSFVTALKNEILRQQKVRILEKCMALELIVEDGVCKGAFLCDAEGKIVEMRAGAVILAAGGAGRLFVQSLNPPDVTGDSYALAYRAGAEIVNMEFMQAGFGIIKPSTALFNSWFWLVDPELVGEDGKPFIENNLPEGISLDKCIEKKGTHFPFSTRDESKYLEISCKRKYNQGGKVFVDLREVEGREHKENLNLAQMWTLTKDWLRNEKGIDLDQDVLQIGCFAHAFNGGALIDRHCETSVQHLYAVGESCGGAHGADRLGGNMFASSQVFGEIAGKHAAATAKTIEKDESEARLIDNPVAGPHGDIDGIYHRIQVLADRTLLIIRSQRGLEQFLKEADEIETALNNCSYADVGEYKKVQEAKNMLLTGRLVANAALARKESRGSHYREDFPEQGDESYRRAIIQKLSNGQNLLTMRKI